MPNFNVVSDYSYRPYGLLPFFKHKRFFLLRELSWTHIPHINVLVGRNILFSVRVMGAMVLTIVIHVGQVATFVHLAEETGYP